MSLADDIKADVEWLRARRKALDEYFADGAEISEMRLIDAQRDAMGAALTILILRGQQLGVIDPDQTP